MASLVARSSLTNSRPLGENWRRPHGPPWVRRVLDAFGLDSEAQAAGSDHEAAAEVQTT